MKEFEQICQDIKDLKIQGAVNVAKKGLEAYSLKPSKDSIKKLLSLRPTEPMLRNVLEYAEKFSVKDAFYLINNHYEKILYYGKKFIKSKRKIFTHCHSSSVVNVLKLNKKLTVFNTETRPLLQGRKTSEELSKAGINIINIVDSAALEYIKKSSAVVFGADAILNNGNVINKIGSGMYAEIAYMHKKPVYIIADSLKYTERIVKIEHRIPEEVWDKELRNLKISNPSFGIINPKYIKSIISDLGILSPKEFVKEAEKIKNKKLICFDMDNTLVYSDKAHVEAFNMALDDLGLSRLPFMVIAKHFGKPKEEVIKAISGSNDEEVIRKINERHNYHLYNETKRYSKKIPGAEKVLRKLRDKYYIAVLSNCSHENIKIILNSAGYDMELFDLVIGNDDVNKPKPWPDEIVKAESLMKINTEYMVGDSIYDVMAAHKAKVKAIAVLSGHYTKEELEQENPYKVIKNLRGLLRIV
jgi:HAD superfamily hydrolase (TIGR01549 family)